MSGRRKMVCLCWVLLEGGNAAAAAAGHLFPSPSSHRPEAGGRAMQALSGISKRVDVIATTDFWKEKKKTRENNNVLLIEASELSER
jgi:hypothetical protein